ncbi:hypothetical protein ABEY55_20050 [Priestia aryabhattai]|uniref:hypothetical protein n=2 Tax=Priestia TaxID=2800373 RepID=UPI003D26C30F
MRLNISKNKIVRSKLGISVPETLIGTITENDITDTETAIEVRSKKVTSIQDFIDTKAELAELAPEEKTKLKQIIQELDSMDEEPQTLLTRVKDKLFEYTSEIEKQWIVPLIIAQLKLAFSHVSLPF